MIELKKNGKRYTCAKTTSGSHIAPTQWPLSTTFVKWVEHRILVEWDTRASPVTFKFYELALAL